MTAAAPITLHFDGDFRRHTVKMGIPPKWHSKPCAKIAEYYAKSFNGVYADRPLDVAKLRMACDADRSVVDLAAPVGAAVAPGGAYTIFEASPGEAGEKLLMTSGRTAKPEPPTPLTYPRRMRVVGRGLLLRDAPALDAPKLAQFPFGAVVMTHEAVDLPDGTTRIRCGADAALPEDAAKTIVFDAARWPREGWGSAKVLAELVHPRKPGINHYVPRTFA